MHRKIRTIALTLCAVSMIGAATGTALAEAPEAEYLRRRPQKEPSTCVDGKGAGCPVQAPRINKRSSTIPGIQKPDHGRPPVNSNPLGTRSTPQIRIFGNPSISGK